MFCYLRIEALSSSSTAALHTRNSRLFVVYLKYWWQSCFVFPWLFHPSSLSLVLGRSEAVVEDFKLNMATPTSRHMIGRCFVATETGTYFEGTGYLKAGETRMETLLWDLVSLSWVSGHPVTTTYQWSRKTEPQPKPSPVLLWKEALFILHFLAIKRINNRSRRLSSLFLQSRSGCVDSIRVQDQQNQRGAFSRQ